MKPRVGLLILACPVIALTPAAQQPPTRYNAFDVQAGALEGGGGGTIQPSKLTGGAKLTFLADDPAQNLTVQANTIEFTYRDDQARTPSEIRLEGEVQIDHPEGAARSARATVRFVEGPGGAMNPVVRLEGGVSIKNARMDMRAGAADIDYATNDARLNGNVRGNVSDQSTSIRNLQADELNINLTTLAYRVTRISAQVRTGDDQETAPLRLTVDDVRDWTAFLTRLRLQAAADAPSPGKHLVGLLDPDVRNGLLNTSVELLVRNREDVLRRINRLLDLPNFYDAESWKGVAAPPQARELLAAPSPSAVERVRLNRWLLHAAFPDLVVPLAQ